MDSHVDCKADVYFQGQLIALFTSDTQVIAQATAVLPLVAFAMVSIPSGLYCCYTPCKAAHCSLVQKMVVLATLCRETEPVQYAGKAMCQNEHVVAAACCCDLHTLLRMHCDVFM